MNTKYIHHTYLIHPLCMSTPSYYYQPLEKTYFTLLPFIFLSVYWWSKGVSPCTSSLNISCFNQINPITYSLSPCSSNIQQLIVQYIILYSYIYIYRLFQYFSFSFPLLPPTVPSDRFTSIILFSFSLYT
jgi:hypothetical protein